MSLRLAATCIRSAHYPPFIARLEESSGAVGNEEGG